MPCGRGVMVFIMPIVLSYTCDLDVKPPALGKVTCKPEGIYSF